MDRAREDSLPAPPGGGRREDQLTSVALLRTLICGYAELTTRDVPPSASALISSLRGVGYSLETAIADIVDNSIAAGARTIEIGLDWNGGDPVLTILDDGTGMTEATLVEAMRFGGIGPEAQRAETDLGRFGLGLKTASLSQCRQLTVASKTSAGASPHSHGTSTLSALVTAAGL